MPTIGPVKRKDLIARLRALGFEPPVSGGDYQYMKGRGRKLRIPNPHAEDIGRGLLLRILRQASAATNGKRSDAAWFPSASIRVHRRPPIDSGI